MDQRYLDLCENVANWWIALGGDSHGRNMCDAMADLIGDGSYEGGVRLARDYNFADGGRRAMSFFGDPMFYQLRRCSAPIVLLHLGGNDLDMETNRHWRSVVHDLLTLFVDLSRGGKIVYIVGLPFRHSRRFQDVRMMQDKIKLINRRLKRDIGTRFIALPPPCFDIRSFRRSWYKPLRNGRWFEERVHLLPYYYSMAADHVLFRLNMDLRNQLSPQADLWEE